MKKKEKKVTESQKIKNMLAVVVTPPSKVTRMLLAAFKAVFSSPKRRTKFCLENKVENVVQSVPH